MAIDQPEVLQARLAEAIEQDASGQEIAALASQLTLATVTATIGQCRLGSEFAQLYPVLDNDGLRWYCTHDEPHCTKVVAEREP